MVIQTCCKSTLIIGIFVALAATLVSVQWEGAKQKVLGYFSFLNPYKSRSLAADTSLILLTKKDKQSNYKDEKSSQLHFPTQNFGIVVALETIDGPELSHELTTAVTQAKKSAEDSALLEEARICMKRAVEFSEHGNRKLAYKLFKHALALNPKFSEALNEFGQFLEEENVVQADMLYQRAVSYDPSHTTALENRRRTEPVVAEHDKKVFSQIDAMKQDLYKYSAHHPTLRSAMKEFYYHHVYHTIALEGNTLSVEEIRSIIDHRKAIAGKSIAEHNEVIGVTEALNYLNNTLLMKIGNITVTDIKNIHRRVLGFVDPIRAGEFRTNQVFVGGHIPPHPNDVDVYMDQFEEWLNSPEVLDLHPVEFAAIAHYRLVYIHPFVDGNGRTARLLMNFILMKHGFPPVSIEVKDRWEYYECLIAANDGDIRPFVRFIAQCTIRTLEDYLFVAELPYIYMQEEVSDLEFPFKFNKSGDEPENRNEDNTVD